MKVRRKIALIFTLLTTIALLFSFTIVYFLSGNYTQSNFYERLSEKATLTAWKYFEEDELTKQSYQKVLKRYQQTMPDTKEIILNSADSALVRDSLIKIMPEYNTKILRAGVKVQFRKHDKQSVGIYYPDNQGNFFIIVTATDKIGIQKQKQLLKVLLCIFFCSIFLIFFIGQLYARRILAPIVDILRNVRKINATNLSLRLKENKGNDELTQLTHMFNQMLERLENSFALQKNFISNASHELKNPLTAIMGETEIALNKKRTSAEYIQALNNIETEADRLNQLINNLLNLAQADSDISNMTKEEIRIDNLFKEIINYFEKTNYAGRVNMNFINSSKNKKPMTLAGNHNLLRIAFTNIIDNACKFSDKQIVQIILQKKDNEIRIEIIDIGIGIPENELMNLSQPFFRASNVLSYKGYGIGLSLAYKIIKLYGGNINITSSVGKGTKVDICFNFTEQDFC